MIKFLDKLRIFIVHLFAYYFMLYLMTIFMVMGFGILFVGGLYLIEIFINFPLSDYLDYKFHTFFEKFKYWFVGMGLFLPLLIFLFSPKNLENLFKDFWNPFFMWGDIE